MTAGVRYHARMTTIPPDIAELLAVGVEHACAELACDAELASQAMTWLESHRCPISYERREADIRTGRPIEWSARITETAAARLHTQERLPRRKRARVSVIGTRCHLEWLNGPLLCGPTRDEIHNCLRAINAGEKLKESPL